MPAINAPAAPAKPAAAPRQAADLEQNLKSINTENQMRQIDRLQQRYQAQPQGGAGLGGFR